MTSRRAIFTIIQLLILIAAGVGIYQLTKPQPPPGNEQPPPADVAVHYGTISLGTVHQYLTVYGTVAPAPNFSAHLSPPPKTVVTAVGCTLGQQVNKDQPLIYLRNPLTNETITTIFSPIAGTVVNLRLRPGDQADRVTTFIDIADLDHLILEAAIPADQFSSITLGQRAEILSRLSSPTTMPTTLPSAATVSQIDPTIDSQTNMASIDIALPSSTALHIGQFISARIILQEHRNVLTVPAEAIVKDLDGKTLINLVKADVAIPRPVKIILRDGDTVEIQGEGLWANQTIVTTGSYSILQTSKLHEIGPDTDD